MSDEVCLVDYVTTISGSYKKPNIEGINCFTVAEMQEVFNFLWSLGFRYDE